EAARRAEGDLLALILGEAGELVLEQSPLRAVLELVARVVHGDAVTPELLLDRELLRHVAGEAVGLRDDQDLEVAPLGGVQHRIEAGEVPVGARLVIVPAGNHGHAEAVYGAIAVLVLRGEAVALGLLQEGADAGVDG